MLAPNLVGYEWGSAVQEITDLAGARGPIDLCGLSLGALVALRVAADRPDDVRRLVVCAGFVRLPTRARRRVRATARVMQLLPAGILRRQLVREIPLPYRPGTLEEIAPLRARYLSRLMREAADFDVDPTQIRTPTLVLCGERDKANLPLARALADGLPRSTLQLVPGAGHVANLDNPQAFTALLVDFLSRSA